VQPLRGHDCLLGMFEDRELVGRILAGNADAFGLLVKQYEKLVFHMVRRLITRQEDAEDICQEVFINVYKHLASFAFESKLATWIARIAYRMAINHLKKHQRPSDVEWSATFEDESWSGNNPEQELIEKDTSTYLNRLIEQLPPAYKTVLTLYHLHEFSYPEIEQITGMPEGTVKSYLFRARKLLKTKLAIYLKDEQV
jgi:RNA polymerase sigma factor (sigma-70 family)